MKPDTFIVYLTMARPRWLIEHGHYERARRSLHWLREGSFNEEYIAYELGRIQDDVDEYKASGTNWLSLFTNKHLFNRLWRASLLQFMAQMVSGFLRSTLHFLL